MMNESESIFHRFCEAQGWQIDRIDASSMPSGTKAPDFILRTECGTRIVVELKQFEPNPEERDREQRKAAGEVVSYHTTPGKRLRGVIRKANAQLKALGGSEPGMLVVHNRTEIPLHDDPHAVLTAMRGLDTIPVCVPEDPGTPVVFGAMEPGFGNKLRADANTSVSCIAVIRTIWPAYGETRHGPTYALDVYHNRFAKQPLGANDMVGRSVTHYDMKDDQSSWIRR